MQTKHGRDCAQNVEVIRGDYRVETQEIRKDERSKIVGWVKEILIMLIVTSQLIWGVSWSR